MMRHLKSIHESLGDGSETFEHDIEPKNVDVDLNNVPGEWRERDLNAVGGKIKWVLDINMGSTGVKWFGVSVPQLALAIMDEDDKEIEVSFQNAETELFDITKSLYLHSIEVDMQESTDQTKWTAKAYFGNP